MAQLLVKLLSKKTCTVEQVNSLMKDIPNILNEMNDQRATGIPLHTAIANRQSPRIIEALLSKGADPNQQDYGRQTPLKIACLYFKHIEGSEKKLYDTIRCLLKYGARSNYKFSNMSYGSFFRFFHRYSRHNSIAETNVYIPILQLIIQYADKETMCFDLSYLIEKTLRKFNKNEVAQENYLQAAKLFLESGAKIESYQWYFIKNAIETSQIYELEKYTQFVMRLFEIILPNFMLNSYGYYSWRFIPRLFEGFKILNTENTDTSEMILNSFNDLHSNCTEEGRAMQSDTLSNGRSLLETLKDSYGMEGKDINNSTDVVYEIMLRFSRRDFPHFSDIIAHVLKRSDLMKLYICIFNERHLSDCNVLLPDCFYSIERFLSKEDMLNYLLALLPR